MEKAELKVVRFGIENVIATSLAPPNGGLTMNFAFGAKDPLIGKSGSSESVSQIADSEMSAEGTWTLAQIGTVFGLESDGYNGISDSKLAELVNEMKYMLDNNGEVVEIGTDDRDTILLSIKDAKFYVDDKVVSYDSNDITFADVIRSTVGTAAEVAVNDNWSEERDTLYSDWLEAKAALDEDPDDPTAQGYEKDAKAAYEKFMAEGYDLSEMSDEELTGDYGKLGVLNNELTGDEFVTQDDYGDPEDEVTLRLTNIKYIDDTESDNYGMYVLTYSHEYEGETIYKWDQSQGDYFEVTEPYTKIVAPTFFETKSVRDLTGIFRDTLWDMKIEGGQVKFVNNDWSVVDKDPGEAEGTVEAKVE